MDIIPSPPSNLSLSLSLPNMSFLTERVLSMSTTYEAKRSEVTAFRRLLSRFTSHPFFCEGEFPRSAFWKQEIGRGLQYLLERVSLPSSTRHDFMDYFNHEIIPLLGPTPQEFKTQGLKPCTFFSDDHTPIELIWAVEADGKMSIRFAMEPLDRVDGIPSPSEDWMMTLRNLKSWERTKMWSLEWTDICRETLILDHAECGGVERAQYPSQFFLGGDFSDDSMVAKFYFLPHLRAAETNVPQEDLVTQCLSRIGLLEPWSQVQSFMHTLPQNQRPIPDMIAVDCVPSSQNRIKVYFRSDATTLNDILHIVRLGGALDEDPLIKQTTDLIENLWNHLFPGVGRNEHIKPSRPKKVAHGFLIYFEMKLGTNRLWPKVYFPVRHYCESDMGIANAVAKFYEPYNEDFSKRYVRDLQNVFRHRDLSSRTGIHTYIGCCVRRGGPQMSIYMSPEIFAPERHL